MNKLHISQFYSVILFSKNCIKYAYVYTIFKYKHVQYKHMHTFTSFFFFLLVKYSNVI